MSQIVLYIAVKNNGDKANLLTNLSLHTCRYIPESPRWLFVTGRELEAKQAMMDIANTNGNSLPPEFSLKVPQEPPRSIGFLDFFSHGKIRLRMLLLMLEW